MALEECLKIDPSYPPCGFHGSCVNGTVCVCDPGWAKSTEFALYLSKDEFRSHSSDYNGLVCNLSETGLRTLYGLTCALAIVVFIYQGGMIKTKKHLKRLAAFMTCCVSAIAFCFLRLVDVNRKVGQDPSATILWAVIHVTGNMAVLVFNNRFIGYQGRATQKLKYHVSKYSPKTMERVQTVIVSVDLIQGVLIMSSAFVNRFNLNVMLLKSYIGIYLIRNVYQLWATGYFTYYVIKDLDLVLKQHEVRDTRVNLSTPSRKISVSDPTASNNQYDQQIIIEKFRRSRKGLKIVHNSLVGCDTIIMFFYAIPFFWNAGYSAFMYYMPIQIVLGMLWSVVVLIAWKNNSVAAKKVQTTPLKGSFTSYVASKKQSKNPSTLDGVHDPMTDKI